AQGREINATLTMRDNAPWQAAIRYLYYNPATAGGKDQSTPASPLSNTSRVDFSACPACLSSGAGSWLLRFFRSPVRSTLYFVPAW
ncbi:hypothetical protein EGM92_33525, partial [Enterobacter cloacae]